MRVVVGTVLQFVFVPSVDGGICLCWHHAFMGCTTLLGLRYIFVATCGDLRQLAATCDGDAHHVQS